MNPCGIKADADISRASKALSEHIEAANVDWVLEGPNRESKVGGMPNSRSGEMERG